MIDQFAAHFEDIASQETYILHVKKPASTDRKEEMPQAPGMARERPAGLSPSLARPALGPPWPSADAALPAGKYLFAEAYCIEKKCDCRNAVINVVNQKSNRELAVICFYFDAAPEGREIFLDPFSKQSVHAEALLAAFVQCINENHDYHAALLRHYVMIREKIGKKPYKGKAFTAPGTKVYQIKPVAPPSRPTDRMEAVSRASGKAQERPAAADRGARKGQVKKTAEQPKETSDRDQVALARDLITKAMRALKRDKSIPQDVIAVIAGHPLIAFTLVEQLAAKTIADDGGNPDDDLRYDATLFLLAEALTEIRYAVDRKKPWAIEAAQRVQEEMIHNFFHPHIEHYIPSDLIQALHDAGMEPSEELIAKNEELLVHFSEHSSVDPGDELDGIMDELAGMDLSPYEQFESIVPQLKILPSDGQLICFHAMMTSPHESIRELASLFFLHSDKEIRTALLEMIRESSIVSMTPPLVLRRLITLRNWLPKDEQPAIDKAVRQLRLARVSCAAMEKGGPIEIYASPFDGSGMEGIYFLKTFPYKTAFAGIMIKEGQGVRDSLAVTLTTKKEADIQRRSLKKSGGLLVDRDFIDRIIQHFLWIGLEAGHPPPPTFLLAVEAAGLEGWQPRQIDMAAHAVLLREEMGQPFQDRRVIDLILDGSELWPQTAMSSTGWFEDDAEVDDIVAACTGEVDDPDDLDEEVLEETVERILHEIVVPRKERWRERLFWMALWSKSLIKKADQIIAWEEFFVVSEELGSSEDPAANPFLMGVAVLTVINALRRDEG